MKSTKSSSAAAQPAAPAALSIDQVTPLLGGMSPEVFMRRYWQKKPLLIRQAIPDVKSPIERSKLFALAGQEEVESRLIVRENALDSAALKKRKTKVSEAGQWTLKHGPFTRRSLPPVDQPGWTLLVQGLDLHVPAAYDLLQQFRFVPDARLDDVMISYATDGGGVGPHYDSYDVFLLQVHGRRHWRVGPLKDDTLQEDVPLRILTRFEAEEEYVLEPGDMLYLPPRWAHDGIAEGGECMTCSVGFRVPEATDLAREVLIRWMEGMTTADKKRLYQDPKQTATATPGLIPDTLRQFTAEAIARVIKDDAGLQSALGEILSEPKPRVWFEQGDMLPDGVGVKLDPRTRMMYDEHRIFANGESWRAGGKDARHLRQLADQRYLSAEVVSKVSGAVRELLDQWAEDGWLHPMA